jgi:hypothetical protein
MGRIQRKKENISGEYDCFFYTLVTSGTKEVEIQIERQIAVINQGYPYEIISSSELGIAREKKELIPILQQMEDKILSIHPDSFKDE